MLGVHGLAALYIATRREALPDNGDDGFSTTVFFFENTLPRNAIQVTKARIRPRVRSPLPVSAAAASAAPAVRSAVAIDWAKEAERAAADSIEAAARTRRNAFGPSAARPHVSVAEPYATRRQFNWDYASTHRFVALPQGGTLINITDRCSLFFSLPILMGSCRIGKIESRADLFTHMRDPVAAEDSSSP
ncbi:MAG TPA: hypothetical protein VHW25_03660 [Steroidobacteraceae bacterium]|nr:hypothetical protein [Steroidobacteraceae bacterium]